MTKKIEIINPASTRFLSLLKQPESENPDPVELDESDVVWSSDHTSESSATSSPPATSSSPLATSSLSPLRRSGSGLSAALDTPSAVLIRRKPALSAASATRLIPTVPINGARTVFPMSAPVNVPVWPKKGPINEVAYDEDEEDDEEEMVPPHIIVARSHVTTFSVFEGVGRTLKGRDLRRVRNAVFQKTGFLD